MCFMGMDTFVTTNGFRWESDVNSSGYNLFQNVYTLTWGKWYETLTCLHLITCWNHSQL